MSQIHILDGQKNIILDFITANNIIDDNHKKSLENTLETYDFRTFADKRFSRFLEKRNRIIIPDEDGSLIEFVIFEAHKYRDSEGYKAQIFANASYLELKKAQVLYPSSFTGSASQHGGRALNNTGWQMGIVEASGSRTLTIEKHTNPYEFLKRIAKEFNAELRFRIEHDGIKVIGRYVDLLERVGQWRGREVEFGKDLDSIRRIEKQDIVTALLGLGPELEDGTRLEVLVEDEEALQRWGRLDEFGKLQHLIEPYEIQSERFEMTEEEARQYTRTALDKRIDTHITYETTIVDLENVPGMENKKICFGDTIRIKDTKFNPPLYLEARVFEQNRSIKSKAKKDIKLGDYIEYTEEQVNEVWTQMQDEIRKRFVRMVIANIVSSAGDVFKNGVGSTDLTAITFVVGNEVDEDGTKYDYQWMKFDKNGNHVLDFYEQGKTITINSSSINEKATYRVLISIDLEVVTIAEITLANIFDGEDGLPGSDGAPGKDGADGKDGKDGYTPIKGTDYFDGKDGQDGKSSYLWVRYSQYPNGNPMTSDPTNAKYIGVATTEISSAPSNYMAYTWSKVRGEDGVPGEQGTDGRTSYLHIKYSNDGGQTFTANNGETVGEWIGTYVDFNQADSVNVNAYTWNKVKGEKGDPGEPGQRGLQGLQGPEGKQGIPGAKGADGLTAYTHIAYADTASGGGFNQNPNGKAYIGMYVDHNPTDSTDPAKYKWSLFKGADGAQGVPGTKGADGRTPYFHTAWANNATGTSGFSTTISANKSYIGTYTDFTQADSTNPSLYSWTKIKGEDGAKGDKGDTGARGPQGIQGPPGANGTSQYMHIRYSANANGNPMTTTPQSNSKYIGLANTTSATAPTGYASYTWALMRGADGTDGAQGVPGQKGADGQTTYTWVKYADNENGGGMSDSPGGKRYIGLAFNKTTPTESNNPSDYSWSPLYEAITPIDGGKIFNNPDGASINQRVANVNGMLIIKTPITSSYMTTINISGYNYQSNKTTLDLSISFYAYSTGILNHSYVNKGDFPIDRVRIGRDSDDRAVIILGDAHTNWRYPAVKVDSAQLTYTTPPDTYQSGWTMEIGTSITGITNVTELSGTDLKQKAEIAQSTADGKNTVIYATTQPSTAGRKINDIWFNTSRDYLMYRFNGSTWVQAPIGEQAIVAHSITANHIKSLFGLNVNNQFIVDSNGNVSFKGNLTGASGTFSGDVTGATGTFGNVNVKDGDFTLEDNVSNVKYRATPSPNLMPDHSFELVKHDSSTENPTSNWAEMINPSEGRRGWRKSGSPKVALVPEGGNLDHRASPIFGSKAIVIRDANFFSQIVAPGLGANGQYTLSAYFKRHWGQTAGGTPRFEVDHMRGGSLVRRLFNEIFAPVPSNYSVTRCAKTFTMPSDYRDTDYLWVKISNGNNNWIQCDGVQLVEGIMPTIYEPEDSVWNALNGVYTVDLIPETLWEGAIYPLSQHKVVPYKKLSECMTGWILQWQAYTPGSGLVNSNFQYSHIPKHTIYHLEGRGHRLNLIRGNNLIEKYIYVHDADIVGNDVNNAGANNSLVLSAIYEY